MKFRRYLGRLFGRFCDKLINKLFIIVLYYKSLCYNTYTDSGYIADTLLVYEKQQQLIYILLTFNEYF
jgi:hypothetical protein